MEKKPIRNLDGFQESRPHNTRAEKYGRDKDPQSGVSGAWFIGTRIIEVKRGKNVLQVGTTKATAKWIESVSEKPCSSQKLRRALKNGHRCNGFTVEYKTKPETK
jgi:hypothetical protein